MSSDSSDSEKEEFLKNLEEAKSEITDSSLMTDSQLSMSEFTEGEFDEYTISLFSIDNEDFQRSLIVIGAAIAAMFGFGIVFEAYRRRGIKIQRKN